MIAQKRKESGYRMKIRTATLFGALMVTLVLAGVSYAMWDKSLWIFGTVDTGKVDVEFTEEWCSDMGTDPGYDKDVGKCESWIDPVDPEILWIEIKNGYPCYSCDVYYIITNTGTIPVKVQSFTVSPPQPEITVKVTSIALGTQIDAGASIKGDLHIHVEQEAGQGLTYKFSVKIYFVQWNEYVPPP